RISRPLAPLNGHRPPTGPQSMLGQWAMVPDQRGVVGDRRSPSRPLMAFGRQGAEHRRAARAVRWEGPGPAGGGGRSAQPEPAFKAFRDARADAAADPATGAHHA